MIIIKKLLIFSLVIAITVISVVNVNYSLTNATVLNPENFTLQNHEGLAKAEDPCDYTRGFVMGEVTYYDAETGYVYFTIMCCWPSIIQNACDFSGEDWFCDYL